MPIGRDHRLFASAAGCAAWLVVALLAPAALFADEAAQTDPPAPPAEESLDPALLTILAELGDEDYAVRDRATVKLLENERLEASNLIELYRRAQTLEQRHRLLDVARHHTVRRMRLRLFEEAGPAGSVGVYHREIEPGALPGLDAPAVEVIRPMPGFPAYVHLRPGDLVLAVEGEPLAEHNISGDFQERIQRHRRGDRITLTIEREGETLDATFRLASRQALRSVYADAHDLRLRSPFAEQWRSVRDELLELAPAPERLHIVDARDDETHQPDDE